MPRRAKPWYRKQTGWWMGHLNRQPLKLIQDLKDDEQRVLEGAATSYNVRQCEAGVRQHRDLSHTSKGSSK
jgi:hypothetical protein